MLSTRCVEEPDVIVKPEVTVVSDVTVEHLLYHVNISV